MLSKRHLVLYGVMALALVVIVTLKLSGYPVQVSYTGQNASTTPDSASTTFPLAAEKRTDFKLEVVTDPKAQEQGLGGRADIPQDYLAFG
jgi:hypothetical protein